MINLKPHLIDAQIFSTQVCACGMEVNFLHPCFLNDPSRGLLRVTSDTSQKIVKFQKMDLTDWI